MTRAHPLPTLPVKDMRGRIYHIPADQIIGIVDNLDSDEIRTVVMLLNGRGDIESPVSASMIDEWYREIVTGKPSRPPSAESDGLDD